MMKKVGGGGVTSQGSPEGQQTYLQAGFPCVADHPTQSSPWADLLDYMLLLGSLKDQEENLIVVIRGHRGERRKDIPNNQQLFPLQQQRYSNNVVGTLKRGVCCICAFLWVSSFKKCSGGKTSPAHLTGGSSSLLLSQLGVSRTGKFWGIQHINSAMCYSVKILWSCHLWGLIKIFGSSTNAWNLRISLQS